MDDSRHKRYYAENASQERTRQKSRRARLRDQLSALKVERGCVDCGFNTHPAALDFDHVRGEKVDGIARLITAGVAWETILAEMEKCEVRCANCHRIVTASRRG